MNHYYTKSWQEFQAKRTRATTSTHSFQLPDVPFDIPAQVDHAIDRWLPRTKALMEEMATLAPSPSRYGSRLRLTGFPISDMFGQEATAVVTNEAAGVSEARKKRTARSLPMPGVRGALVRAEDHGYQPRPGAFLVSPHVAQEIAWLQAEVTWSIDVGQPPLRVEDGHPEVAGEVPVIRLDAPRGHLVIPAGGPRLRCHALLFTLGVDEAGVVSEGSAAATAPAIPVELAALEPGGWQPAAAFTLPGQGTYLGLWPWRSGLGPSRPCASRSTARARSGSTTWRC
jgi:hypothetical protein